jgi:ribosomal-protein-alanine N-acetyltransferase
MNITGKIFHELPTQQIIQMDQDFFPHPWTEDQWKELDSYKLLTWRSDDELLGFALFRIVLNDDVAHLLKLFIRPSVRGTQETGAFWNEIIQELRGHGQSSLYLEVESQNQRAIRFYQKHGFKLLRINKGYYSSGEDALIMSMRF